jgi:hypothetical protein
MAAKHGRDGLWLPRAINYPSAAADSTASNAPQLNPRPGQKVQMTAKRDLRVTYLNALVIIHPASPTLFQAIDDR